MMDATFERIVELLSRNCARLSYLSSVYSIKRQTLLDRRGRHGEFQLELASQRPQAPLFALTCIPDALRLATAAMNRKTPEMLAPVRLNTNHAALSRPVHYR